LSLEVFTQKNFAAAFCDAIRHYAYLLNVYVFQSHAFGDQISHGIKRHVHVTLSVRIVHQWLRHPK